MTDPNQMWKQMADFQRVAFDSSLNAMAMAHTRTEKMTELFMKQSSWFSEKLQDTFKNWADVYNEGCEIFRKRMEHYSNRF